MEAAAKNGAACGHGALAAVLGCSVTEAMRWLKPGWVNIPGMKRALDLHSARWQRVTRLDEGDCGLILVQWIGPWMRWRKAACKYRHWVGTRRGYVWDANTRQWQTQDEWKEFAKAELIPDDCTGWELAVYLKVFPK